MFLSGKNIFIPVWMIALGLPSGRGDGLANSVYQTLSCQQEEGQAASNTQIPLLLNPESIHAPRTLLRHPDRVMSLALEANGAR